MSLGLFNCRLIQPTGDQLFFLSAVLPHRCQFGQALFSLLVARPARPRPAGGRRMLLAFPSQKDFAWFSAGAKSRRRQKSSLPPIHPRIFPKIHLTLPIDSAIEPEVRIVDDGHSQEEYIRQVLEAYRKTPGTTGTVRRTDRMLAAQLYQRGVAVTVVENAFVLAAARRLMRPADAPPLGTIRSLAYFLPVIAEVLDMRVSPEYFQHVRRKLERIACDR